MNADMLVLLIYVLGFLLWEVGVTLRRRWALKNGKPDDPSLGWPATSMLALFWFASIPVLLIWYAIGVGEKWSAKRYEQAARRRETLRETPMRFGVQHGTYPTVARYVDFSAVLGTGTVVWHFAVILADVVIGRDCSIGSRAEIGRGCKIGDRTRIGSGAFLPPNAVIGSDVFIGPGAIFTDDRHPRAGNTGYHAEPPRVEDGASIGAGAVILPGVVIGAGAMVGAGSVVTKDVPPRAVVHGEAARMKYLYQEAY